MLQTLMWSCRLHIYGKIQFRGHHELALPHRSVGRDGTDLPFDAAGGSRGWPAAKHKVDPRDARISALEAEVKALAGTVSELRDAQQQTAAVQAQQATQQDQIAQIAAAQQKNDTEVAAVKDAVNKPKVGPAVNVSLAAGKPLFATADGRFSLNVHAIMQLDTGFYDQKKAGPIATDLRAAARLSCPRVDFAHARDLKDGTLFRRARIGVDGKAFGDWDYSSCSTSAARASRTPASSTRAGCSIPA